MLRKIESLPGVDVAQGSIEDEVRLVDKQGEAVGKPGTGAAVGVDASADQSLNPLQLVEGQWPVGEGQIAVDTSTAKKQHFAVGQTVGAFGDGPVAKYRVSGIVRFGEEGALGGTSISVFDLADRAAVVRQAGQVRPDPGRR